MSMLTDQDAGGTEAEPIDPLELRSMPRVGADLPACLHSTDFSGPLLTRTRDLSVVGACVATASPFSIKSVYSVELDLAVGRVKIPCEGRWQREEGSEGLMLTGLEFCDPDSFAREGLWTTVVDAGKHLARFLHENSALQELGLEEAMGLAQITRYREVSVGATIYRQGTLNPGEDSIFLLQRGEVAIQLRMKDAIQTDIARLSPGSLFGGLPMLTNAPHVESAIAATDCRLLEIDRGAFRYIRTAKPWLGHRLGSALLRVSAERVQQTLTTLQA